ncbi:cysteine synthase A [uncultured Granulicatella sp.]|uniref:cysteine synthase A n=1 Tax=uncultured Granulicatella sp. TaxID=316089 RepID=UPI0026301A34|nr:cysteine synthase A [uncultured Granulicatella sp.]
MVKSVETITELIGNTPLVKLNRLVSDDSADVYVKVESFNAGGSVKDRIALNIIETAEKDGSLNPGDTIIEATSGNTGVGLSLIGAAKGYKVITIMPESMSIERRQLMKAYGTEVLLTPAADGFGAAVAKAEELAAQPGYFWARQFDNEANPAIHYQTTGQEIINAFDGKTPDAYISGIGTGGTITGVGRALKEVNKDVEIIGVEPEEAPFISKGQKGKHRIQGISAGFEPSIIDREVIDGFELVTSDDAIETAKILAAKEGILAGISSGAAVTAALRVAKRLGKGKSVVVLLPDTGERYLSTGIFGEA